MSGCRKISALLNSYFVSVFSEEEGGDLLKSGFSFPGTPEEELGTDPLYSGTARAPGWAGAQGLLCSPRAPLRQSAPSQSLPGLPHLLCKVRERRGK